MTELLRIRDLLAGYRAGARQPEDVVREAYRRIAARGEDHVWIHLVPEAEALEAVASLKARAKDLPLHGVPFAIKDNIDVAGVPTTAGCPAYAYTPSVTAPVVQRLLDAGAILIGKTNMDQFATGLVGTRSPHGACRSVYHPDYVSGGSSSGSGVAVAAGLVSFALGTDTAGSGRVPAAFNGIVGLKPSRGLFSSRGVVPACRSLDCVSIFAGDAEDAALVLNVAAAFDADDPFSRALPALPVAAKRMGVPVAAQCEFFGDAQAEQAWRAAVKQAAARGFDVIEVDIRPLLECAQLLYAGPWVAERYAAVGEWLETHSDAAHPVVRDIILGGKRPSAVDAFRAQYRLQEFQRATQSLWRSIDALLLPTTPTMYTVRDVQEHPVTLNSRLGIYTNFVNLLDLAAIAVPGGLRDDGLPFGVSFIAPAGADRRLLQLAARWEGAAEASALAPGTVRVAVVGAHLSGQPLNHQLTSRGATLEQATRTAPRYRLFALPTTPPKPGLIRQDAPVGVGIDVEVWQMPVAAFGSFVAEIPGPLGIGTLELQDGTTVHGFVCESYAVADAPEITHLGGWRAYLAQRRAAAL